MLKSKLALMRLALDANGCLIYVKCNPKGYPLSYETYDKLLH